MQSEKRAEPDSSAVRVALWRALHVEVDAPPPVLNDTVGLKIADPPPDWRQRPDMHPQGTKPFRASIIARARFIDDLVIEQSKRGVDQYVILGAGLDSFAQRMPEVASRLTIFEVDQRGPQAWKRQRLEESGLGVPNYLKLVPVDFEAGANWWHEIVSAGFNPDKPAVVASTGVSMYLTKEANAATLAQVATLAPGSTFAMSFIMPLHFADPALRPILEMAEKGARASGTPFLSYYEPGEIVQVARNAGFKTAKHVSSAVLSERYFANRTDDLRPALNTEELLVASTDE